MFPTCLVIIPHILDRFIVKLIAGDFGLGCCRVCVFDVSCLDFLACECDCVIILRVLQCFSGMGTAVDFRNIVCFVNVFSVFVRNFSSVNVIFSFFSAFLNVFCYGNRDRFGNSGGFPVWYFRPVLPLFTTI